MSVSAPSATSLLGSLLLAAWLFTVLFGTLRFTRHLHALRGVLAGAQPLTLSTTAQQEFTRAARLLRVPAPPCHTASIPGPALAGLFHPRLLLPAAFATYTSVQRQAVFAHELAHLRRRDPASQQLMQCLSILLLWHPVTFLVLRQLELSRELATDALAARTLHSPHRYAACLLALAESMLSAPAAPAFSLSFLNARTLAGVRRQPHPSPSPDKPNSSAHPNHPQNPLEQRIMRLIRPVPALPACYRIPATVAGTLLFGAATALAASFPIPPPATGAALSAVSAPTAQAALPGPVPVAAPAQQNPIPPPAQIAPPPPPSPAEPTAATPHPPPPPPQAGLDRPFNPGLPIDAARMQQEIAQSTAYLRSPEFQQQIRDASNVNTEQIRRQVEQSTAFLRSPEFQQQLRDASRVDADKIRREVAQSTAYLRSPAFQKEMRDAAKINADQIRREVEQSTAYLRSPEFRQQLRDAAKPPTPPAN